jgi:hypothetical protein
MVFPQYRKYSNGQSYFKIVSETELTELKIFGSLFEIHHINAKILPERVMIADLLHEYKSFAEMIDEQAFEAKLIYCKENLKQI